MAKQDETKTDLTRIDQLPTLEHEDDPAIDQLFAEQAAAEEAGKFSALEDDTPAEVLAEEDTPPAFHPEQNTESDFAQDAAQSDDPNANFLSSNETAAENSADSENSENTGNWAASTTPNENSNQDENLDSNFAESWPPTATEEDNPPNIEDNFAPSDAALDASEQDQIQDQNQDQNQDNNLAQETNFGPDDSDDELDIAPLPEENAAAINDEQELADNDHLPDETKSFSPPSAEQDNTEETTGKVHFLDAANVAKTPADSLSAENASTPSPDSSLTSSSASSPIFDESLAKTDPAALQENAYSEFPEIKTAAVNLPPLKNDPTDKTSTLQDFAQAVFPASASSAAPAYSLKLEDIDPEQHEAIMAIIREAKIYAPADENLLRQSLASGKLLIAQISEYLAVTLAHQLRRLAGKIVWGLAQDVHPSASYSLEENRGNVQHSLPGQNTAQTYDATRGGRELSSIILTTAPQVEGRTIGRYLDLITEQAFLRPSQLGPQKTDLLKASEEEAVDVSEEIASWDIYRDLCLRLRQKALAAQADAVVNLNFTLQPIFLATGERGHHLRVTGNLVTLTDPR